METATETVAKDINTEETKAVCVVRAVGTAYGVGAGAVATEYASGAVGTAYKAKTIGRVGVVGVETYPSYYLSFNDFCFDRFGRRHRV
ncbi:hypothetical protein AX774_g7693 [Zancudomyces culisetae]|uniref:Uncharacterized protein n=1 Tax=Zancudomyces culisetae TaxID=1213189 RepID=A0A1R1PD74_ZANCU|nr:hypothetical protein AX774_g7693 [Zancudomyces culisetae]|eukprot:OMH78906.1 hypothetical protein AX774_g7693 [Zancudomyces culisetae]